MSDQERAHWAIGTNREIFNAVAGTVLLSFAIGVFAYYGAFLIDEYGLQRKPLVEVGAQRNELFFPGLIVALVSGLTTFFMTTPRKLRWLLNCREKWRTATIRVVCIEAKAVQAYESMLPGIAPVYLFDIESASYLMFGNDLDSYSVRDDYEWDESEVPDQYRTFPCDRFQVEYDSVLNRRIGLMLHGKYLRPLGAVGQWTDPLPPNDCIIAERG
jgi:hypothetical protein